MIPLHRYMWRNSNIIRGFTTSPVILSNNDDNNKDQKQLTQDDGNNSKEEVTVKLNNLLNMMIKESDKQPKKSVVLVQAVNKRKEKKEKEKSLGERLEEAAKEVATNLGGNVEKTESDLLKALLQPQLPVRGLSNVLADMKVDNTDSRAQQVRVSMGGQPQLERTNMRKYRKKTDTSAYVNILGAPPSSYFKNFTPQPAGCELRTWRSCLARDLRLAVTHPPSNIYEQMIQWTDKGMLWHFPIDNFQGLEEEKQVPFEEHIFLDQHLEGWCPERGPIRQFMDLVCVGLSKNYWLTAEEKKKHIIWFRDYFADKKALIKELGAGDVNVEVDQKIDLFESVIHRPQD